MVLDRGGGRIQQEATGGRVWGGREAGIRREGGEKGKRKGERGRRGEVERDENDQKKDPRDDAASAMMRT